MPLGLARGLAATFLVAFAVAVTWPGMVPANRIYPLVLGLPFSLAWVAAWIVAGCLVLWMLHASETAHRRRAREESVRGTSGPGGTR